MSDNFATVHACRSPEMEPIDVTADENPALRARVKAKYLSALTLIQLPDGSWVKGVTVRRTAKDDGGAYMLMLAA